MYKIKNTICLIGLLIIGYNSLTAQTNKSIAVSENRKFDYFFYKAMNAKAMNHYGEAFDYLQYCHKLDSTNANVLYELGIFYNLSDDKNQAMNYYRKAAEYDKNNFYYNIAYATICLENKQYSDAIEQYEKLLKSNPENSELYIYLSEAYRLDGNLPKAIKALDDLEKSVGLNEKISVQKFQLYTLQKQEKKAFAEIQKYIDKYPTEIKYQVLLGDLYMQSEKTDEAFAIYKKAKALDPENPILITSMVEYYERTNNKTDAEKEMYTALMNNKMDIDTKLSILAQYVGTLQQTQQGTETANALFDTLMVQHPQEPDLNLMYGNLLLIQDKKEDARFQYRIYAEANPTDPTGWEQMVKTTFPDSIGQTIKVCESAISYVPDQPIFYFYLGISQYINENYKEALKSLKEGVEYVDENNASLLSEFYGQMGDLYYQLGQTDSAFMSYNKSLQYNPNNLGILNNYSYYLSLSNKDLDKAEKMSSLTVKAEPSNPTYLDTYGWVLFKQKAYIMAKIYIENALKYTAESDKPVSSEILEHYGDILYMMDDKDKALEYWIRAKDAGESKSKTLDRKIETKTYIE